MPGLTYSGASPNPVSAARRYRDLLLLACGVLLTRAACRSHYLYDIDSVNFGLGLRRFDTSVHQPHPPGYFLYVCLGRWLDRLVFHDANAALVAISLLASCGALLFVYRLTEDWFGPTAALFAGLLFLLSPLVWFHGTVALTYAPELFFSSLAGYGCWRVYSGQQRALAPCAMSIAAAAGFRPSFLLFLLPLLLFSAWRVPRKAQMTAAAAFLLTLLAWVVPMVWVSGGPVAYWNAFYSLWRTVPGSQTVLNSSAVHSLVRLGSIIFIYGLCFGAAALLPLFLLVPDAARTPVSRPLRRFIWIWVAPGLLFFTFVFLKFVNAGYLLVLSPPMFAVLGMRLGDWWSRRRGAAMRALLLVPLVAVNGLTYFRAPLYCSFSSVRRFERELESVLAAIPKLASPQETVIVGFDSHFLGYRHAGYYLPAYWTLQHPEVHLVSGIRVFGMRDGDTALFQKLPVAPYKRFLCVPLPGGDQEYRDFLVKLKGKFPPGVLQTEVVEGKEYISGPISCLSILFPTTAPPTRCAAGERR